MEYKPSTRQQPSAQPTMHTHYNQLQVLHVNLLRVQLENSQVRNYYRHPQQQPRNDSITRGCGSWGCVSRNSCRHPQQRNDSTKWATGQGRCAPHATADSDTWWDSSLCSLNDRQPVSSQQPITSQAPSHSKPFRATFFTTQPFQPGVQPSCKPSTQLSRKRTS
jgi:hypothetical protein